MNKKRMKCMTQVDVVHTCIYIERDGGREREGEEGHEASGHDINVDFHVYTYIYIYICI